MPGPGRPRGACPPRDTGTLKKRRGWGPAAPLAARPKVSKPLSWLLPIEAPQGGRRLATPRWKRFDDFLEDLPRYHCAVKPDHSFCTVCLRINSSVAMDCPWKDPPSPPRKRVKAKAVLTRGGPSKPSAPPPPALDFGPAPLPEPAHDQAVLPPAPPPHPVPAPPPPR